MAATGKPRFLSLHEKRDMKGPKASRVPVAQLKQRFYIITTPVWCEHALLRGFGPVAPTT